MRKEAWNRLISRAVTHSKEAENGEISRKEASLKFMKLLKFFGDIKTSYRSILEKFWIEWFGLHAGREIFNHGRIFLQAHNEFIEYVSRSIEEGSPAWASVQPFRERDVVFGLDRLFFDFDCEEDLSRAWKETTHFVSVLDRFYHIKPLICFSGRKGYHVYVFLWNVVEFPVGKQPLAKKVYAKLEEKLLKGLNYETLDRGVIGDVKRLARVPYSIHEETKQPCVPINLKHEPLLVFSLEGYRNYGVSEDLFRLTLNEVLSVEKHKTKTALHVPSKFNGKIRPCIKAALEKPLEGSSGHLMRLAIAIEFLNAGWKTEDVAELFQNQHDYSFEKSRYMVEHALKRGYKPRKCRTIQAYGFCLEEACPIFRKRKGDIKK